MTHPVLAETKDGIATITVNRPDVRNALSREVQAELHQQLDAATGNDDVRAVIFTGAGDRAFVAGADIKQLKGYTQSDGLAGRLQHLLDRIEGFDKPTIAAVNGLALGGGCELALACDIRIAAATARFGFPETGLSIIPGAGGTQRLGRLVGLGRALDMILSGRIIDAEEALSAGLITRVAADDELASQARQVALDIITKGPLATRLAKLAVRAAYETDSRTGQSIERLAQALLHESADKQEGIAALLEKRAARFEGR